MAIELRGVAYRYPGTPRPVLIELDLAISPGEVVGVAGPNEAGKSTLCLVAAGLAPGVVGGGLEGSVTIDGTATSSLKAYELAQRCGILFQNSVTQLSGTSRSVWEEIAFGPRNLGLPVADVVERVERSMAALAITGLGERDPQRLSGGQAQLVALAAVLALRPQYLVLDEPTSQLDPQGTLLVGDALAAVASEAGTGILLVEHKTDLLARMAHRVLVLDAGRVARQGSASAVLADVGLRGLGVEPPSGVELLRATRDAGVPIEPAALEAGGVAIQRSGALPAVPAPAASAPGAVRRAIELESVGFVYPDGTRALSEVSFTIPAGQRLAIVGQNGSGKSTLVRQLNGLLQPTEGRVLLDGRDMKGRHVADLAASVGLAFQNPDRQIFAGRVRREVEFGPKNLGMRGRALDDAVTAALAAVGLLEVAHLNPYDLGYSRRKLLAMASVLAMATPIVVLDEPTTGQDARGLAHVEAIVASLAASGRTVLAISHDMRFVADSFERIVVLRDGRLVLDGPPAEVFAEANWQVLASTFLQPPLAARVGARQGLGSTPTTAALVSALRRRGSIA